MVTMEVDRAAATTAATRDSIDEVRYSRLIHAIGKEAADRLVGSRVLICGCRGIGAEIAKNLVLSGVSVLGLVDDGNVSVEDLGSQMLLKEGDVGSVRAVATVCSLKELNPLVEAVVVAEADFESSLKDYHLVVMTTGSIPRLCYINRICRAAGVMFIAAFSRGVFSYVFVDLGDSFTVVDETGEAPEPVLIESITQDFPATVSVVEEQKHGLEDEDEVVFSGIVGMEELNDREPAPVTVTGPSSFTIPVDSRGFSRYVSGGYFLRRKPEKRMSFAALEKSLLAPEFCISDPTKASRAAQLHVAFQAVDEFERQRGSSLAGACSMLNDNDMNEVTKLAREIWQRSDTLMRGSGHKDAVVDVRREADISMLENRQEEPGPSDRGTDMDGGVNEDIVRMIAHAGTVELCPIVAITGGIAAQEAIKALTRLFTPVHQWLYFDAMECLPSRLTSLEERSPLGSRYDCQAAVFGRDFQSKLNNSQWLVVGAGGIGSEVLKNLVLMGVGCGTHGKIVLTDRDSVSKANLVDQVLYRVEDVDRPKTPTAARALRRINPAVDVHALQESFDSESESIFDSSFFDSMAGVISAVDTASSRLYIDMRCVNSRRPMIDGGKFGTKGSVQVFVPFQSEMYASTRDPPEHKDFPICTLRNFPYSIQHTLQWAVETFETLFKQRPNDVNSYLSSREFQESLKKSSPGARLPILETIRDALVRYRPLSFEACVQWARLQFEDLFTNNIKQLLFNFPPGMKASSGAPFWSGTKRLPTPLAFDSSNPLHLDFIIAASNLQATVYGLKGCRDNMFFIGVLEKVVVPPFQPKEGVRIALNDNELRASTQRRSNSDNDTALTCEAILQELPTPSSLVGYCLSPIEFDKDDERNFHVDFIAAAANLRACNYRIPLATKLQARLLGGRVIPAVITSTSVVAGLMCLELYKLVQEKQLTEHRHWYLNLSLPTFCSAQPIKAVKHKVARSNGGELAWTLWDKFEMDCVGMTLEKFLASFKQQQGLEITMLSYGKSLLYAEFLPRKKLQDRFRMTLLELVTEVGKVKVPASESKLVLSISCTDANGDDVEVPDVVAMVKLSPGRQQ